MSENVRTGAGSRIDLFEVRRWAYGVAIIGSAEFVCGIVFTATMPPANFGVLKAGGIVALVWTADCIRLALKAAALRG